MAVLHVDASLRATLKTLIEGRGHAVVEVDSLDSLHEASDRGPIALLLVDALTLQAVGLDSLEAAAKGDRPQTHVPVLLVAEHGDPVLDMPGMDVDEVVWEPIVPRELALRIESGLARRRTTELLAIAGHELRSPIHAVSAFLDLLERSELPSAQREMVQGARTASRHLIDLVEDLLEHARLGQGPVDLEDAPFSLRDVVRDATSIALDAARADHAPVEITASFDEEMPETFRGDGPRVRQILINLLSNGLKFAAAGPVRVSVRQVLERIEIEVADDGPGVPEAAHALVFEPFRQADRTVTRRFGGTGLGLALARTLASRMDGDVVVRSGPDERGAVFTVTLALGTIQTHEQVKLPARPRALIADGDAIHRAMTAELLARIGYSVDAASEGVATMFHAIEHPPTLLVLDLELPLIDGIEIARRLRAAHTAFPIVAFGLAPNEAIRARAAAVGITAVLPKPVAPLLLQRVLRQAAPVGPKLSVRPDHDPSEDVSGERAKNDASRQMNEALRAMIDAVEVHGRALDVAIARQDLAVAAEVTRALRGAVIALNARGLEVVLRDLEQAARAGDVEEARRAHAAWRVALAALRDNVDRFLVRAGHTQAS